MEWSTLASMDHVVLYNSSVIMDRYRRWYVFPHTNPDDSSKLYYQRYEASINQWSTHRIVLDERYIALALGDDGQGRGRAPIFPCVAIPLHWNHTILLISMTRAVEYITPNGDPYRFYLLDLTTDRLQQLEWKWPKATLEPISLGNHPQPSGGDGSVESKYRTRVQYGNVINDDETPCITASNVCMYDDNHLCIIGSSSSGGYINNSTRECWCMDIRHQPGIWFTIPSLPNNEYSSVVGVIDQPEWWGT
jgi:hypothetical protein